MTNHDTTRNLKHMKHRIALATTFIIVITALSINADMLAHGIVASIGAIIAVLIDDRTREHYDH